MTSTPVGAIAAATAVPSVRPPSSLSLGAAAESVLEHLMQGRTVDAAALRRAMTSAFGGSDAEGAWDWKTAYDACEAATVLFLRRFGPAMRARAGSPPAMLTMLA